MNTVVPEQLVGVWNLVSWRCIDHAGPVIHPFGDRPVGRLVYTADGFMSAQLAAADRPPFESDSFMRATPDEMGASYKTFMAYCGRVEVFDDYVIHRVEMSLFPNWVGTVQKRFFELIGDDGGGGEDGSGADRASGGEDGSSVTGSDGGGMTDGGTGGGLGIRTGIASGAELILRPPVYERKGRTFTDELRWSRN